MEDYCERFEERLEMFGTGLDEVIKAGLELWETMTLDEVMKKVKRIENKELTCKKKEKKERRPRPIRKP